MGLALPPSLKAIWEGRIDFVGQERVHAWQQTTLIIAAVRPYPFLYHLIPLLHGADDERKLTRRPYTHP